VRLWSGAVIVLTAAVLASCAGGSRGAPITATPPRQQDAAPQATLPSPGFLYRWGFDPGEATGLSDPAPKFKPLPAGYRIEAFASGLDRPTAIAFLPDGRLLVAEQRGAIRIVQDGRVRFPPLYEADAHHPDSVEGLSELGLVGLVASPGFDEDGYVYFYYVAAEPEQRTVLARVRVEGDRGLEYEEIFGLDAAPACCHVAGSLRFAPDGTLFVMVGDHQREPDAQEVSAPYGKVLRILPDGGVPRDNPFASDPEADPRVYAYGLRNPYDIAIDPQSGRMFATENGVVGQDAIVEVRAGANYGWPGWNLALPLDQMAAPLLFYHETHGPSGADFYRGSALAELDGTLLFCQFHGGGALHAVSFDEAGNVREDAILAPGCTSDVQTGPDGFIYFVDYVGGVIYRIVKS
jgi:glucose/arabinose dehydrogenase